MNKSLINDSGADEEVWTSERCYIRELMNDPRVPESSLAETRVEPGVTTQWHRLSVAEWYVVTRGEGIMELGDDEPFRVVAGDAVAIPAGTPQRISNRGDSALVFYCLCLPRFTPDCYTALDAP